jgi:methylmalonyl-CoA mutase N-terminal domain/subunit
METLFDQIPLATVSTSMTINATAPILLAMYIATAQKQDVPADQLRGTVQNDILKEYVARGTYIFPPAASMRLTRDVIAYCTQNLPNFNPISISGYHMREAGATAAQEIAFTLANAIGYIQTSLDAGLHIDDFAPRLSFFFAVHTDLFEEAAKFRAARRLYANIMKSRFGAKDPRSMQLRCHAQTGGVTLTAQQPDNNVARVTIQALAAVLGGVQSLHTNGKDEALALPTEASARLALRTQQIIAHESGAALTPDPLGGSYYVEALTDQLEKQATELLATIDKLGGVVRAIERGYLQQQIEQSSYQHGKSIESKDRIIVGVNQYTDNTKQQIETFKPDPQATTSQLASLKRLRQNRNNAAVTVALESLRTAAKTKDNLMPLILQAVQTYATLGEISAILRQSFGEQSTL